MVKAERRGREDIVWTRLLDPLQNPADRGWVSADVDLAKYAGSTELVLETRGYEEGAEPKRAFWGAPAVTEDAKPAPLVVVYLVDTLRADHTGPYGYTRDTTPELDAFAKDAVVFDQAIAAASWTKPSVASLFTSLPPGRHRAVQLRDHLDDGVLTLAEMLQARGYATGAAIANSVIYLPAANFQQGFDYFEGLHGDEDRPSKIVEAAPVVDRALAWIDARRGLPTFLYVHTMDPHVPYTPPAPFDAKFEPHPTPEHPGQDPRTDYKEPADRERLMAQYDGEIAYGDLQFGRFLRELKSRGLYDDALIVFLGDHGEEFLDHGKWLHGRSVFDELVRVPLVLKLPGRRGAGRRIEQQVQVLDVLPTVLESQGLPVPPAPVVTGRALQAVLAGQAKDAPAASEISHRGIVAHGLRTNRDKYIRRFSPETDELYFDLAKDPKEQTSVLGTNPERERLLRAGVEDSFVPNPFRYVVKATGASEYVLAFATAGFVMAPERHRPRTGRGPGGQGRRSSARGAPPPAGRRSPRDRLWPPAAGRSGDPGGHPRWPTPPTRRRRPRPGGLRAPGRALRAAPARGRGRTRAGATSSPRPGTSGAASPVWLVLDKDKSVMAMDKETLANGMKALGYVDTCAGF